MKSLLVGRIDSSELYNNKVYTVVTEPAVDQYSSPQRFKVRSDSQLGAVNSEVRLEVTFQGNVRTKNYRDKDTGQQKQFQEDNVYLEATVAQAAPTARKAS